MQLLEGVYAPPTQKLKDILFLVIGILLLVSMPASLGAL